MKCVGGKKRGVGVFTKSDGVITGVLLMTVKVPGYCVLITTSTTTATSR